MTERKLVDDPFIPGQQTTETMAKVHPSQRLSEAVAARLTPAKRSQEDAS